MRPLTGIEPRVGRRPNSTRDAEERAEGVERVEPSVEAERELVEIGLWRTRHPSELSPGRRAGRIVGKSR